MGNRGSLTARPSLDEGSSFTGMQRTQSSYGGHGDLDDGDGLPRTMTVFASFRQYSTRIKTSSYKKTRGGIGFVRKTYHSFSELKRRESRMSCASKNSGRSEEVGVPAYLRSNASNDYLKVNIDVNITRCSTENIADLDYDESAILFDDAYRGCSPAMQDSGSSIGASTPTSIREPPGSLCGSPLQEDFVAPSSYEERGTLSPDMISGHRVAGRSYSSNSAKVDSERDALSSSKLQVPGSILRSRSDTYEKQETAVRFTLEVPKNPGEPAPAKPVSASDPEFSRRASVLQMVGVKNNGTTPVQNLISQMTLTPSKHATKVTPPNSRSPSISDSYALTTAQILLVRNFWNQVYQTKGPTVIGGLLFDRIFFKNPFAKEMFHKADSVREGASGMGVYANQDQLMKAHAKGVAQMLEHLISNLEDLESQSAFLHEIGARHAYLYELGFHNSIWERFGEAILDRSIEWGEKKQRVEQTRKAWAIIISFIVERLQRGFRDGRKMNLRTKMVLYRTNSTKLLHKPSSCNNFVRDAPKMSVQYARPSPPPLIRYNSVQDDTIQNQHKNNLLNVSSSFTVPPVLAIQSS